MQQQTHATATATLFQTLFLIRGLPGSGKTTLGTFLESHTFLSLHFEADAYFYNEKGEYHFNPALLDDAHKHCLQQTEKGMQNRVDHIFVTNTFSQRWEMEPYWELAALHNYNVFVIETQNAFANTHNVPTRTIDNMIARWQDATTINRRDK